MGGEIKSHCPCSDQSCPLTAALAVLGGKWKLQIICALWGEGPVRFNELRRRLRGISNTVLTAALKDLEEHGLVERRQFLEVPPRVEYMATGQCGELKPIIGLLAGWGGAIRPPGEADASPPTA